MTFSTLLQGVVVFHFPYYAAFCWTNTTQYIYPWYCWRAFGLLLVCFQSVVILNFTAKSISMKCLNAQVHALPLAIFLGVRLLDQKLFSKVVVPTYTLTSSMWQFLLVGPSGYGSLKGCNQGVGWGCGLMSGLLPWYSVVCLFNFSHSHGCRGSSPCSFNFHFPHYKWGWEPLYIFVDHLDLFWRGF